MSVRFRIRTPAGQELSFATLDVFENFVRSGDLSPDDLVYDAEDGSWSPARTHPMVLEIEYQEEDASAASEPDEPSPVETEAQDPSFGLSLAPEQPGPGDDVTERAGESDGSLDEESPADPAAASASEGALELDLAPAVEVSEEEATRAFVQRMEAEREASLDYGERSGVQGFSMDDSSTLGDMLTPSPPPPARARPERTPAPRPDPAKRTASETSRPEPRSGAAKTGTTGKTAKTSTAAGRSGGGGFSRFLMLVVGLGVVGAGGYFGYQSVQSVEDAETERAAPVEPLPVAPEPEPEPTREPVIAQTESAIRERAQERFLTSTQNALRDLPPIPETWATGPYFSVPSDYPDVLDAWERYLTTIRSVQAGETDRYVVAYDRALDDAAIAQNEWATRRAAALEGFGASEAERSAHYDRVEALAAAAIRSHEALVESEGLILFEPGSGSGGGSGMGADVYGRDEEADLLLAQVVELLSVSLDGGGLGPGDGVNVRSWVWDGFLDAATR